MFAKMLRNPQVILLYLFFICNEVLSKEAVNEPNNIKYINAWECKSNDECTATNSVCQNNLCQCAPGYIFNAAMTSCIKIVSGLYDSCEETVQCSAYLLSGAKCINNICICSPGYYYLHGRCNRYVGLYEKCKRDINCYVNADFEASICNGGTCKCSPGFYQREYRTCRREGKKVGEECTINNDCIFDNATCSMFMCTTSQETTELISSDTTSIIDNSDANEEIRVGSNCTDNRNCQALGNAVCSAVGKCRCDRAHFASATGTKCIPELGEPCSRENQKSYIEKSFCRERRWSCTNGTVASKNNRECLKVTRKYNGHCKHNEQCYILGPDAVCSDNKCVCNETVSHYIESELFCWINRGVGETCKRNQDCYVKGFKGELICENNICGCPDGTHLSKNKMACINGSAGLGEICEVHDDCVTSNSVCEKEVCSCVKNYYQLNEQCLAGINSICVNNEDCTPENSICVLEMCSCKPNYTSAAINSCIPISSYDELCSLNVQCSNIPDAICASKQIEKADIANSLETIESKVCTCGEDRYYKFGKCLNKRFLGEACTNIDECYESVETEQQRKKIICKNSKCACDWGYKKWNSSMCQEHFHATMFFLNSGITNVISTGLFLSILLHIFL